MAQIKEIGYRQDEILGAELSSPRVITVGATSVSIAGARARTNLYIKNTSTGGQVITLALSNFSVAVAGTGIVLGVNDVFVDSAGENYTPWTGNINAISSAANGTITIFER